MPFLAGAATIAGMSATTARPGDGRTRVARQRRVLVVLWGLVLALAAGGAAGHELAGHPVSPATPATSASR